MREITGELWDYYGRPNTVVGITTNGFVKTSGSAVMGRGCAAEANKRFPELPSILGAHIREEGNVCWEMSFVPIFFFPVKHNWWNQADLKLIEQSAGRLYVFADDEPKKIYVLPRPGCGNGRLTWEQVRPVIQFLPDNVWVISKP